MKRWIRTILLLFGCIVPVGAADTEPAPATSPEVEAVAKQARLYEEAFNKADAKALGAMYAEDVEYTDEDGGLLVGREALEAQLKKNFVLNPGAKLAIEIDSVRMLSPDVGVERGTTVTTSPDGKQASSTYTAVHVRKDGKWLISQLVESPAPAPSPSEKLSDLAWMVGAWKEKDGDTEVETKTDWARGGNFLTRSFKVTVGGEVNLEGWQIIGWDAAEDQIRSWLFDSGGAFAEAVWTRSGDDWLIRQTGVLADGGQTSSESTLHRVDNDKCIYESTNRTLDGDPQPNLPRIEMIRVKEQ